MKVLISAQACNPVWGSEAAVGWSAAIAISRHHNVWVLCHEMNREPIEKWSATHLMPAGVCINYYGVVKPWHPNRFIARIQSWKSTFAAQQEILEPAAALHKKVGFDLVHHVSIATWRSCSRLHQLGIPLIWGPLGGGEMFPWSYIAILSPASLAFEAVREVSNFISRHSPGVKKCARKSAVCVGANDETAALLKQLHHGEARQLLQVFFLEDKIQEFAQRMTHRQYEGPLKFFAGGNLEARKGVAIALQGLKIAAERGVQFDYQIAGNGPDRGHLQKLTAKLGLEKQVHFSDGFSGTAYRDQLFGSHVYLLPSLRESAGITLMEGMLAGCVPVVADCGGPHNIVSDGSGFRLSVTSPKSMAADIADVLVRLDSDRKVLEKMGRSAHERIASTFNEARYFQSISAFYDEARLFAVSTRMNVGS